MHAVLLRFAWLDMFEPVCDLYVLAAQNRTVAIAGLADLEQHGTRVKY